MYESFYGLKEKPFTLLPDPDYLYLSPKHQRALTLLEYGMMNQAGFSVICGDTGAGKTTLIRRLLTELGDDTRVGLITNTHHSFGELLNWVLMAFGLDGEGKSKSQMHQMFISFLIEQYAKNKHTVLIVDEAQNMNADTLEELRMLSNINSDKDQVLQVILAGQPALRETLRKPELMQFAQRIAVDYYLESLSAEETNTYINHRLKVAGAENRIFTDDACQAIYEYSKGTPRLINLLCDTSLVYGYAEQSNAISAQLVHDVVREQHSNSIIPTFNSGSENTSSSTNARATEQLMEKWEEETDKKVSESSVSYEAVEEQKVTVDPQITDAVNSDELPDEIHQQAASVVNSSDQAVPVKNTSAPSGIEKAQYRSSKSEHVKDADDSNVTPIKVKQSEPGKDTEKVNQLESDQKESVVDTESQEYVSTEALHSNKASEENETEKNHDENLRHAIHGRREDDVYPIVHIEENPRKGLNMMLLGLVGGMFIASIFMMIAAWLMFGDKNNTSKGVQSEVSQQAQNEVENRELSAIKKERDAAIAVTRALERERDAALQAAKAQEEIRAAELRAAEILAEQERRVEKRLQVARARAREAERAEAKALARERKLEQKAEKREAELETQRIEMKRKEQLLRLETLAAEEEKIKNHRLAEQEAAKALAKPVVEKVEVKPAKKIEEKRSESFSANPCNSPSAKFLSTCKK